KSSEGVYMILRTRFCADNKPVLIASEGAEEAKSQGDEENAQETRLFKRVEWRGGRHKIE
ncbi:MAG TPA: hypothetical protein PLU50_04665, partial [Pseudobdellovibrionaceae bacterium]|nr:hypothetical protein [Pseudobdellovibrionaceae bacterium]